MLSKEPGRKNPFTKLLTEAFESMMREIMIGMPGHVVTFDSETQLAQVQCGIKRIIQGSPESIPVIDNVPVNFAGDAEWYMWHQIKKGTEGVVMFSQRAIDLWIERGGVIKPHDLRMFSESDAYFIPGVRSKPGKIPNFINEGIGMSNYAGTEYIHMKPGAIDLKTTEFTISGNIVHTGDYDHTGNMTRQGDTSTQGTLTNNGKNVGSTHKHSGVQTGGGTSGEPI